MGLMLAIRELEALFVGIPLGDQQKVTAFYGLPVEGGMKADHKQDTVFA